MPRRGVVARGGKADPLEVGLLRRHPRRGRAPAPFPACMHEPVRKDHLGRGDGCAGLLRQEAGRDGREPLAEGDAGVLHRPSVHIGAGRCRGCRSVGHLVGACRHHADALRPDPQLPHGHAEHLGVQSLSHLRAAVVHLHGAVRVDQHERPRLVECRAGERDAELLRRHGEAALHPGVPRIPCVDLRAGALEILPVPAPAATWPGAGCHRSPGRSAWCLFLRCRGRGCGRAPPRGPARACAPPGPGSPQSRAFPAARRSRGRQCAKWCSSWQPGR